MNKEELSANVIRDGHCLQMVPNAWTQEKSHVTTGLSKLICGIAYEMNVLFKGIKEEDSAQNQD